MQNNGTALQPPAPPTSPPEALEARPNPEVVPAPAKAKRRQFTASYKLQVLEDTDRLPDGEIGAYLRKQGLYFSHLTTWRSLRKDDVLAKLAAMKPGRTNAADPSVREIAGLRKELGNAKEQLRRANLILDVQKKVLSLCGEIAASESKA